MDNDNLTDKDKPVSQTPQESDLKQNQTTTSTNEEAGAESSGGILQEEKESAENSK